MTEIPDGEYQRRYDIIARHHLDYHLEHGVNPWMSQEPELRAWTVRQAAKWIEVDSVVLDAGCGIGLMLGDLTAVYPDTVGVDISVDYVEYARSRGLDARVGWLERLPFAARSFDAVVCCDVLEHVRDPRLVVDELRRVLKPGGVLVVRVPDGDATGVGADGGFGFPVHLQQWDATQLHAFLGGELLGSDVWENELVMGVTL